LEGLIHFLIFDGEKERRGGGERKGKFFLVPTSRLTSQAVKKKGY